MYNSKTKSISIASHPSDLLENKYAKSVQKLQNINTYNVYQSFKKKSITITWQHQVYFRLAFLKNIYATFHNVILLFPFKTQIRV